MENVLLSDVLGFYLKMAPERAMYTEALCKDWHEYMDKPVRWLYRMRGVAVAISEGNHGRINRLHL